MSSLSIFWLSRLFICVLLYKLARPRPPRWFAAFYCSYDVPCMIYLSLSGSLNIGLLFFLISGLIGLSDCVVSEVIKDCALSTPNDDLLLEKLESWDSRSWLRLANGLPPFNSLLYCRINLRFRSFSSLIYIVNYLCFCGPVCMPPWPNRVLKWWYASLCYFIWFSKSAIDRSVPVLEVVFVFVALSMMSCWMALFWRSRSA